MTTITEFILARVAEREAFAKGVIMAIETSPGSFVSLGLDHPELAAGDCPGYIRDYEPERVLVECGAMRCIVEECRDLINSFGDWDAEPDTVAMWTDVSRRERSQAHGRLGVLAAIWADHADYREEWRA